MAKRLPRGTGNVYFILARNAKRIKIGWCSAHPDRRLADLQCGCPELLLLVGYITGACKGREARIHREFDSLRTHGEWFRINKRLIRFINRYAKMDPFEPFPEQGDSPLTGGLYELVGAS